MSFASKKETANDIYNFLKARKYKAGLLTGDLSSRERKNVMKQLANGQIYILVCSDMAARGLDIENVTDILNVDLPNNLEFYYHRAGRTGRFDKKGNCYSFFNADSTKKPLALIENGVDFKFKTLKNGELVDSKGIVRTHPNKKKCSFHRYCPLYNDIFFQKETALFTISSANINPMANKTP